MISLDKLEVFIISASSFLFYFHRRSHIMFLKMPSSVGLTVSYFFQLREIRNCTKQVTVSPSFDRFAKLKKIRKYEKSVLSCFAKLKKRFVSQFRRFFIEILFLLFEFLNIHSSFVLFIRVSYLFSIFVPLIRVVYLFSSLITFLQ